VKSNQKIELRIAKYNDYKKILLFLKKYWNKNHIFVKKEKFFQYELCNPIPQFILATNNNKIIGLVGFYSYSENYKESDLFLVLLRVIENFSNYQVAIKLIIFIKNLTSKKIHTIGATKETLPLYNLLKFKTGWLDHYYWINNNLKDFSLCKIHEKKRKLFSNKKFKINNISKTYPKQISKKKYLSLLYWSHIRKSFWYFKKRYIKHPIFKYEIYEINKANKEISGLGVLRVVNLNNKKCIRIIDWIGDLNYFGVFLKYSCNLASEIDAEFVDLYCSGISSSKILSSGFKKITSKEIIPNHLSPIEYKNIPISFVSSDNKNLVFFRGDCDQDRPN
tara:strand:- start:240 stop:1244 length:1005 start_codon:yes stop_codon:yes gene_type:complete